MNNRSNSVINSSNNDDTVAQPSLTESTPENVKIIGHDSLSYKDRKENSSTPLTESNPENKEHSSLGDNKLSDHKETSDQNLEQSELMLIEIQVYKNEINEIHRTRLKKLWEGSKNELSAKQIEFLIFLIEEQRNVTILQIIYNTIRNTKSKENLIFLNQLFEELKLKEIPQKQQELINNLKKCQNKWLQNEPAKRYFDLLTKTLEVTDYTNYPTMLYLDLILGYKILISVGENYFSESISTLRKFILTHLSPIKQYIINNLESFLQTINQHSNQRDRYNGAIALIDDLLTMSDIDSPWDSKLEDAIKKAYEKDIAFGRSPKTNPYLNALRLCQMEIKKDQPFVKSKDELNGFKIRLDDKHAERVLITKNSDVKKEIEDSNSLDSKEDSKQDEKKQIDPKETSLKSEGINIQNLTSILQKYQNKWFKNKLKKQNINVLLDLLKGDFFKNKFELHSHLKIMHRVISKRYRDDPYFYYEEVVKSDYTKTIEKCIFELLSPEKKAIITKLEAYKNSSSLLTSDRIYNVTNLIHILLMKPKLDNSWLHELTNAIKNAEKKDKSLRGGLNNNSPYILCLRECIKFLANEDLIIQEVDRLDTKIDKISTIINISTSQKKELEKNIEDKKHEQKDIKTSKESIENKINIAIKSRDELIEIKRTLLEPRKILPMSSSGFFTNRTTIDSERENFINHEINLAKAEADMLFRRNLALLQEFKLYELDSLNLTTLDPHQLTIYLDLNKESIDSLDRTIDNYVFFYKMQEKKWELRKYPKLEKKAEIEEKSLQGKNDYEILFSSITDQELENKGIDINEITKNKTSLSNMTQDVSNKILFNYIQPTYLKIKQANNILKLKVINQVISETDIQKRAIILERWIMVMNIAKEQKNFPAVFAIHHAVHNIIASFHETKKYISNNANEAITEIDIITGQKEDPNKKISDEKKLIKTEQKVNPDQKISDEKKFIKINLDKKFDMVYIGKEPSLNIIPDLTDFVERIEKLKINCADTSSQAKFAILTLNKLKDIISANKLDYSNFEFIKNIKFSLLLPNLYLYERKYSNESPSNNTQSRIIKEIDNIKNRNTVEHNEIYSELVRFLKKNDKILLESIASQIPYHEKVLLEYKTDIQKKHIEAIDFIARCKSGMDKELPGNTDTWNTRITSSPMNENSNFKQILMIQDASKRYKENKKNTKDQTNSNHSPSFKEISEKLWAALKNLFSPDKENDLTKNESFRRKG